MTCGHESIHLCNNAVQARYTNAERSSKLPTVIFFNDSYFKDIYIFRFIYFLISGQYVGQQDFHSVFKGEWRWR